MKNQEVCSYIDENVNVHQNWRKQDYVADELVKNGYGQTCGGYLDISKEKINRSEAEPNQKIHFLEYYGDDKRKEKYPSYDRLHCPQLLLWVAEISGLDIRSLNEAKDFIIKFEEDKELKNKNKGGTYLDSGVEMDFKRILKISCINKILKRSSNWDEVLEQVSKLNIL